MKKKLIYLLLAGSCLGTSLATTVYAEDSQVQEDNFSSQDLTVSDGLSVRDYISVEVVDPSIASAEIIAAPYRGIKITKRKSILQVFVRSIS